MIVATIYNDGEYMPVRADGCITRKCLGDGFSKQWRLIGAVRLNNFGRMVEYKSFPQCLEIKDWAHKNGKQRWHIKDFDHGTRRMWANQSHSIIKREVF